MSKFIEMHRAVLKTACLLMLAACNPIKVPAADAAASDPKKPGVSGLDFPLTREPIIISKMVVTVLKEE